MDFNRPDVYIQDVSTGASPIQQASSTIGILIGAMKSGPVNEPVLVSSWTEFIQNFANGLETPFMKSSDLPYSVYGFFANGGSSVYVVRVASNTAKKAKATGTLNTGLQIEAKYPGAIAPTVQIKKSADWAESTNEVFDVIVTMSSSDEGVTTITEVTKDTIVDTINSNISTQNWIVAKAETALTKLQEETITLADGADGIEDLADSNYVSALEVCSTIDDASFLAIPGQTSKTVNDGILTYCDAHMLFPILDMPIGSTVKETKEYRKSISAYGGCLAYPWGVVSDPLTNGTKTVPTAGHVMGVYSRVIGQQGIKKAPAGVDAVVKGFLSMEKKLTDAEIGQLNPVGVICIVSRTNAGIVEIGRLGVKMGGKFESFCGLTGIGDLIVTCASVHSRNRKAGYLMGQGKSMEEAMKEVNMVVEGVYSAKAATKLAQKYEVPMPIVDEINKVLFEGKDPKQAVDDLMLRESKIENSSLLWEE